MKKILVVYNCCGIRQSNLPMWSSHLNNILKQNYEKLDIKFITFRDFNSDTKDELNMKQFNDNILKLILI